MLFGLSTRDSYSCAGIGMEERNDHGADTPRAVSADSSQLHPKRRNGRGPRAQRGLREARNRALHTTLGVRPYRITLARRRWRLAGVIRATIAGSSILGGLSGCGWGGPDCVEYGAPIEVQVSQQLCEGTITGAGACAEEFSCWTYPRPACCEHWNGTLRPPAGSLCTITLTMPDGGESTRTVEVQLLGDGDCIDSATVEFH